MICDYQTNKVYLADGIRHYMPMCWNLINALEKEGIAFSFLPKTESEKHIWARDYMPIQIEKDKFLRYKYEPDYLWGFEDYIPEYRAIDKYLNLDCKSTDIILDGGNVIKCGDKVIMTDKILKENRYRHKYKMIAKLEDLLEAEIVLIPWDREEEFGHADGMVRYIEGNRVLMNNYAKFDPLFRDKLISALIPHFKVEEFFYYTPRHSQYSWAYINFLQIGSTIFVPGLGIDEDLLAVEKIQATYPNCKVIKIDGCQDLVRDGGALNCISWNIKCDLTEKENEVLPNTI